MRHGCRVAATAIGIVALVLVAPATVRAQSTTCTLDATSQTCATAPATTAAPTLDVNLTAQPLAALTLTTTLTSDRLFGLHQSVSGAAGADGTNGLSPTPGGAGGTADALSYTVNFGTFDISTSAIILLGFQLSPPDDGITVRSTGGRGGDGGDSTDIAAQGRGGGRGGNGGTIDLKTTSLGGGITTTGLSGGIGILAISSGGAGGTGGDAGGVTGFGGDGGLGGNGGSVTVDANNFITTTGRRAVGIFAQSRGGNGGNGGDAGGIVSGGGSGSDTGNGGEVKVTNSGAIRTSGAFAYGIFAQSIGGFGGDAGGAGGVVAFSGDASSGGDGRAVTITNYGAITTTGMFSHALFAQSVGGSGGDAGGVGGVVALGGNGDGGGVAGTVTVDNYGAISATGLLSRGIFAQSIGGGGGNGSGSGGVVVIGGRGNAGGNGGDVFVNNYAPVTSRGSALIAQSIGGGGGSAGSGGGLVTVGGTGASGGSGGDVTVTNAGALTVLANGGRGIFAQSVGGGGGDGDFNGGIVAIGGSGSHSSSGGNVSVTNSGSVVSRAHSIFAQSIGGGGGDGGTTAGWFSIGGQAGGGGDAGTVTVVNTGALSAAQANVSGLFAQSLGGGGGNGGGSVAVGGFLTVGLGGFAGEGGSAKKVDVTNYAPSIVTVGGGSHGIFAQSTGGGGGSGGFSAAVSGGVGISITVGIARPGTTGGNGAEVVVRSSGAITTTGDEAFGIFAQSAGGGGGSGGWSVAAAGSDSFAGSLSIGAKGGIGGHASTVRVDTLPGWIQTSGDNAVGLFAQSIGGGGGRGGFSVSGAGAGVGTLALSFGGSGGGGGNSDTVTVDSLSRITTSGLEAHALQAQSVGGGGGSGFFSIAGAGAGAGAGSLSIGGSGGAGGVGRAVSVTSGGDLETHGVRAIGLFAQSVGGGGGNGSFSVAGSGAGTGSGVFSLGGKGAGGGSSGGVSVFSTSKITTTGEDGHGLLAQSVGGGGGNGGFSIALTGAGTGSGAVNFGGRGDGGGNGGGVLLESFGRIETSGLGANGIVAQSLGGGGGHGRFAITGSGAGTGSGAVSVGGFAGGGGSGGTVTAFVGGGIVTHSDEAVGLQVQSIGGGGGNGGFSVGGSGAGVGSGAVTIGGFGGGGGSGGAVIVANSATIDTGGKSSYGLFAQSVGGGGGLGHFAIAGSGAQSGSGTFGLGGSGGSGGAGSSVHVSNFGAITTQGEKAFGLLAQSVGGGGGAGGFSFSGGVVMTGGQLNSGLGGSGGVGGDAARVDTFNLARVTTFGDGAHGLFAQSVGGGGGAGGFSGSIGASGAASLVKPNVSVGVGGWGGVAGDGAQVRLQNFSFGTVVTEGLAAHGLFAQSIGGGGGDGGDSFAIALGTGDGAANGGLTIGGRGATAGDAGAVHVINSASVTTKTERSHAVLAQSLGGGGGTGGFAATGVLGGGASTANVAVAIGGKGGAGGIGADVTVDNFAMLTVRGGSASGIFAQSVGGGGGDGGFRFSGLLGVGGSKDAGVAVGGNGGIGNVAGHVFVTNSGAIDTGLDVSQAAVRAELEAPTVPLTDERLQELLETLTLATPAAGIVAQSLGGGGGNGGHSFVLGAGSKGKENTIDLTGALAIGGHGGDGNAGGRVDVLNSGSITTRTHDSDAIFLQSVGGGGGNGGMNRTAIVTLSTGDGDALGANIAVGGEGGSGNVGGLVMAANSAPLTTFGDISAGIRAQSIGGGGGKGGAAGGANIMMEAPDFEKPKPGDPDAVEVSMTASVGGNGGGGNHAGAVTITNLGKIETRGAISQGLFAQSVGGGGGIGGNGMSGIATDEETLIGFLEFMTDDMLGFVNDFFDALVKGPQEVLTDKFKDLLTTWDVTVGGNAGASGNGDAVTVDNFGGITTFGLQSSAIYAQSVGGGGGLGLGYRTEQSAGGSADGGFDGKAVIGGAGGAAGNGAAVVVNNYGVLRTVRDNSYGIFAQSVGGGGGEAGTPVREIDFAGIPVKEVTFGLGVTRAREGGGDGAGGAVTVTNSGEIWTLGNGSAGIFAQSVGGGGGVTLDFAGSVGGGGSAGAVTVTQLGSIKTEGSGADGIFAQSAAGADLGGLVKIDVTGSIVAQGGGSSGIFAQSRGTAGAGDIQITLNSGQIVGGIDAPAIKIVDGANNSITNFGLLSTQAGVRGTTVIASTGNDTIDNFGTMVGSLSLGEGTNTFSNASSGQFYAGSRLDLGAGNVFLNSGFFSVGDTGAIALTRMTGDFSHVRGSRWLVDLGEVGVSDRLEIDGRGVPSFSIAVAGGTPGTTIDLNLMTTPASTGAYTFITATGGGLANTDFRFGTLFGEMPVGRTFAFSHSDAATQLTLLPSTGSFVWSGNTSDVWTSGFVAGASNWRRADGGSFIFGTPGLASDVNFATGGHTALGANFGIRGLTFGGSGSIAAGHALSLGSGGITVHAGDVALAPNLDLAADQSWINNGDGMLRIIGAPVSGAGRHLTVGGAGSISIAAGVNTGAGSLTKVGGGTLFLSGANTYTGGTSVLGGMLVSNTRSLRGAIRNDAVVVFDEAVDGVYDGAMTGTGALYKLGAGELRLTGANSYSGGTGVLAGSLRGDSTSLQGDILADATVIFDQDVDGIFAGNLFGAGAFTKLGAGTLRMTGLGGGFTGKVSILEGQLAMEGQLAGDLTMHTGTVLGGTGLVPGVTLLNGATLAPGDSIGTLRVIGDVLFQNSSTYRVETHANGTSDLTVAGGQLTAGGGTVQVLTGDSAAYRPITRYEIFWAGGGIAAPFAGVTIDASFLNPSLHYVGNEVRLTLRRTDVDFRPGTRGTAAAVAAHLNGLVATADGAIATAVNDVYALSDDDAVKAMQSMSGLHYQHVASGGLAEVRRFMHVNLGRLGQPVPGDAIAAVPGQRNTPGWWLRILDSRTRLTGADGDPGADMPSSGLALGVDGRIGQSVTIGVSGARTTPHFTQDGLGDRTTARMFHVGAYGSYRHRASRLDAAFVVSEQDLETRREITIGAPVFAEGAYDGHARSWRVEFGHAVRASDAIRIEGVIGAHVDAFTVDAIEERGHGVLDLRIPKRSLSSQRSVLGARVERTFTRASGLRMRLEGRALWMHEFSEPSRVRTQFAADVSTTGFEMAPVPWGREGGLLSATFYGDTRGGFRGFADVTFETGGPVRSVMASLGIGRRW